MLACVHIIDVVRRDPSVDDEVLVIRHDTEHLFAGADDAADRLEPEIEDGSADGRDQSCSRQTIEALPDLLFHLDAAGLRLRELLVDVLLALDRDVDDLQLRLAYLFVRPGDAGQQLSLLAGEVRFASLQREQPRFAFIALLVHILDDDNFLADQLVLASNAL
jgi:hypothetical protein